MEAQNLRTSPEDEWDATPCEVCGQGCLYGSVHLACAASRRAWREAPAKALEEAADVFDTQLYADPHYGSWLRERARQYRRGAGTAAPRPGRIVTEGRPSPGLLADLVEDGLAERVSAAPRPQEETDA